MSGRKKLLACLGGGEVRGTRWRGEAPGTTAKSELGRPPTAVATTDDDDDDPGPKGVLDDDDVIPAGGDDEVVDRRDGTGGDNEDVDDGEGAGAPADGGVAVPLGAAVAAAGRRSTSAW
jgi:hypothetical protein